jgi:hypothetical protein
MSSPVNRVARPVASVSRTPDANDTLDRTTDCTGAVSARTFAEIELCDAAY